MAGELLIFDAAASNVDGTDPGTALNIGPGTLYGLRAFDAPTPAQTVQYAGSVDTEGSLPASRKHENRVISVTVLCTTAAALKTLQVKIGKIAREGGTLKWVLPTADTVIFDLHAADTFAPRIDKLFYVRMGGYCEVSMTLPAKPYGRGAEEDLGDNVETTLPCLVFTDTAVKGDVPGLGRLVIDEDQAQDQLTVLWGIQSRYYDASSPLFFQAESGTAAAGVAAAGPAGASGSGSNTIYNSTVPLYPTYDTDFGIGGAHVGTFRVIARVQVPATNAGTVSVRLEWRANTSAQIPNDWVVLDPLTEGHWLLVDLGQVTSRTMPVGTTSLTLAFDSTSTVNNDDVYWDWVALIPVDEGSAEVGATSGIGASGFPLPASGHLQIGSDYAFAQSSSGWGRPARYEGSYLTIPPAGNEARTVRVIVKASRGRLTPSSSAASALDFDAGTDDISAHLYYTPRYLVVPSA